MATKGSTMTLSGDDLLLVNNALNEVLNGPGAIDEWEFQTRLGVERPRALELLTRIGRHLGSQAKQ